MSTQIEILGRWTTTLPGDVAARLAVAAQGGEYAVLYSDSDTWDALAFAYDEKSALRAATLIAHLAAMPEHLRIGGDSILAGADTDHPGVEWIAPTEVVDDPDPAVRLTGPGTRRLWALPSTDGEVLGLLNPDEEPRDIAEFVSTSAADAFIAFLDAMLGDRAYGEK
ncbi:hypothetical protein nbrc107696_32500 [Gordonia spumicola]|uniref:Uncharacterized protein n=1 Tax=Gordonia spumicola TaxID=589161 RepID=A0A7I9VC05_9ACTN|nr:hypothetical protein [Gordonia spumicola]GEE02804.1 hypothetical protein nbrc107696_32500 [Gordonia spumicola]